MKRKLAFSLVFATLSEGSAVAPPFAGACGGVTARIAGDRRDEVCQELKSLSRWAE